MTLNGFKHGLTKLALLALCAASSIALAQEGALTKRVDIFLQDGDLYTATQVLTRQTGIQFVIAPSNEPFGKINLSLRGVTAEEAIRYICQAAGAWAEQDENGVFIIRQGKAEADVVKPKVEVPKPRVMRKIQIMKADPKVVYDFVMKGETIDPMAELQELNRYRDATMQLGGFKPSTPTSGNNSDFTGVTTYPGSDASMRQAPSVAPPMGQQTGNGVLLPGETARQLQPGGGGPGGGAGGQGLTGGQGFVPEGIDRVIYDPTDNSIVVQGTDEAIRLLQQRIALFDVAPRQVLIKVEFINTRSNFSNSFGVDWFYARGGIVAGATPGYFARPGDPIFVNYATGNITSRLRASLQSGEGKVLTAPIIRTLNNQPASVQSVTRTFVFIPIADNAAGGITRTFRPEEVTVNTFLVVRPRINNDNTITVNLTPQIEDFVGTVTGPDGQQLPVRASNSINVVARVKSGETIVLGGLTKKLGTSNTKRFPVLSDLPIIGQFFRSSERTTNNDELLIFVTPTIIEDDVDGNTGP